MLKSHFDTLEGVLLERSKTPSITGHPNHKGSPREAFISQFLRAHLSDRLAIGTGEIIDANSKPAEPRNQLDIVIYRPDFPRLDFEGGIHGYLVESVIATIEVKSCLSKPELAQASRAARAVKLLEGNISPIMAAGWRPPSILSFVVAYDGPAKLATVHKWLPAINAEEGIDYPTLPLTEDRVKVASPSLDAVFVLGRGFMHFGNAPVGFFRDKPDRDPEAKWAVVDCLRGSLLLLFLMLTKAASGVNVSILNPMPYLRGFSVQECFLGR